MDYCWWSACVCGPSPPYWVGFLCMGVGYICVHRALRIKPGSTDRCRVSSLRESDQWGDSYMLNSNTFTLISCCYRKVSAYFKVWLVKRMSISAIGSTLTHLLLSRERATPPHIQVCYCMWLSFIRPSPHIITACDPVTTSKEMRTGRSRKSSSKTTNWC